MENIGEDIRRRRRSMKMSQQTLSEGICSQSMISRLENNQLNISFGELLHVLDRLNMSLHDLMYQEDKTEAKILRKRLDQARDYSEYDKIIGIIHHEKTRGFWRSTIELEAYYQWHHGLIKFVRDKNPQNALICLDEAIRLSERNHLMSFSLPEIYIAKGNIYNELGRSDMTCYKKAAEYYEVLNEKIPKMELKILYNIICTNCKQGEYRAVDRDCDKAIRKLNQYDSSYLICEIYYFKMLAYIKLEQLPKFWELREWTVHLFKEKNKLKLLSNLENYS